VSVVSFAEIRRGVAAHGEGAAARRALLNGSRPTGDRFAGRILAIDQETAFTWGDLMAEAKRRGIGLSSMDGLLAATASAHGLTFATRNTKDFRDLGVMLFDP